MNFSLDAWEIVDAVGQGKPDVGFVRRVCWRWAPLIVDHQGILLNHGFMIMQSCYDRLLRDRSMKLCDGGQLALPLHCDQCGYIDRVSAEC